jgi:5-hydroxyisourate hydrolase-like protein (transthyretin family)
MKTKMLVFSSSLFLLAACSSKVVNSGDNTPWVMNNSGNVNAPMQPPDQTQDIMRQASPSGIAGRVLLSGDVPVPLSKVQMALYKNEAARWREVTRFTTETDGTFSITQKLVSGSYELRILDKRYEGTLPVSLDTSPVRNLVLEATRRGP